MHHYRNSMVAFAMLVSCIFSACNVQKSRLFFRDIPLLEENENGCNIVTTRYDGDMLDRIYAFSGTIDELKALYPIEYIRNIDGVHYRFFYIGDNRIVGWHYNKELDELYDHFQGTVSIENLDSIQKGSILSLDDISALNDVDPYVTHPGSGYYGIFVLDFLHYTRDGYIVYYEFEKCSDGYVVKERNNSLI